MKIYAHPPFETGVSTAEIKFANEKENLHKRTLNVNKETLLGIKDADGNFTVPAKPVLSFSKNAGKNTVSDDTPLSDLRAKLRDLWKVGYTNEADYYWRKESRYSITIDLHNENYRSSDAVDTSKITASTVHMLNGGISGQHCLLDGNTLMSTYNGGYNNVSGKLSSLKFLYLSDFEDPETIKSILTQVANILYYDPKDLSNDKKGLLLAPTRFSEKINCLDDIFFDKDGNMNFYCKSFSVPPKKRTLKNDYLVYATIDELYISKLTDEISTKALNMNNIGKIDIEANVDESGNILDEWLFSGVYTKSNDLFINTGVGIVLQEELSSKDEGVYEDEFGVFHVKKLTKKILSLLNRSNGLLRRETEEKISTKFNCTSRQEVSTYIFYDPCLITEETVQEVKEVVRNQERVELFKEPEEVTRLFDLKLCYLPDENGVSEPVEGPADRKFHPLMDDVLSSEVEVIDVTN